MFEFCNNCKNLKYNSDFNIYICGRTKKNLTGLTKSQIDIECRKAYDVDNPIKF